MEENYYSYQIKPAPPRMKLQEYIEKYIIESNEKYFNWFLHYYENAINQAVKKYMERFFMPEHFDDIKQAYIMGLLKALQNYDLSQGTPFLSYKEWYTDREILDYIRSMRTGYTTQSLAEYAKLRKAMAVWDKYDRNYSQTTLSLVADELEESISDTKEILRGGMLNENRAGEYMEYTNTDGDTEIEYAIADSSTNTYYLVLQNELYTKLWEEYEKLDYTERKMIAQYVGFCFDCHSPYYVDYEDVNEYGELKMKEIKPMAYTDIATDHEYSSANTAKKIIQKALGEIGKGIEDLIR